MRKDPAKRNRGSIHVNSSCRVFIQLLMSLSPSVMTYKRPDLWMSRMAEFNEKRRIRDPEGRKLYADDGGEQ